MLKSKTIEIDGNVYVLRELTMEEGLPLFSATGDIDIPGLVRAATTMNGNPVKIGDISLSVAMRLTPTIMELNSFSGGLEGNG